MDREINVEAGAFRSSRIDENEASPLTRVKTPILRWSNPVREYWSGPRSQDDPYVEATDGPFALDEAAPADQKSESSAEPK